MASHVDAYDAIASASRPASEVSGLAAPRVPTLDARRVAWPLVPDRARADVGELDSASHDSPHARLAKPPATATAPATTARADVGEHDSASHDPPHARLAKPPATARHDGVIWLVVVFFALAVLRRAWMCDDAFITMRAVDNLVAGRGFVFNVGERVLGFTNPLWALLVAVPYSFIRNPYLVPVMLGVLVSTATAVIVLRRGTGNRWTAALVLVALCFSRAFVDFSTSGLENPLTHLLLVLLTVEFLKPSGASVLKLSLLASLAVVNRPDLLLLSAPLVGAAWWGLRRARATRRVLLGALPAIAWFGFATAYYGFPLPNTVYAKLNAIIPKTELAQQGLAYLVDVVINDPMTAVILLTALFVLVATGWRDKKALVLLVTLSLGISYVVTIGGDFMSGRFLTPHLAIAAVVLSHHGARLIEDRMRLWIAAASVAGMVLSISFSPFRDDPLHEKREIPKNRIVNERAWYQEHLSLLVNLRPVAWRENGLYLEGMRAREKQQRVAVFGNIGMYSWGAGPGVHVVDNLALTDPLLARIPFSYSTDWRTGHLGREVPSGYLASIEHGANRIEDPCLARYYDRLKRVIRGPIFSTERISAIWALNSPGGITVRLCPGATAVASAPVARR